MFKNIFGLMATASGVGITLTTLEQSIRIAGGMVGLLIGLFTLFQMIRAYLKKRKNKCECESETEAEATSEEN